MTHKKTLWLNCFLCLSSNLGDRLKNLKNAVLELRPQVKILSESMIYQTPPWGYTEQPDFLNQVLYTCTKLNPFDLLTLVKEIERLLGREATFRYGPRLIDIDILFYEDWVIQSPTLTIPHPRLHERAFVLVPLEDLAPDLVHPVIGKTVRKMLECVDRSGIMPYHPNNNKE